MGARENECQISENYILLMKFSELYLCFTILEKFDIHFLGLHEEYSLVLLQMTNYFEN